MTARTTHVARRRIVFWVIAAVVLVLIALSAWIGVRGYLAARDLKNATPVASRIEKAIVAGDPSAASASVAKLNASTADATNLTSDPIWRAAELIPGLGVNLRALRESASAAHDLSTQVVSPLTSAASGISVSSFKPVHGAIDLAPLEKVAPALTSAATRMHVIAGRVADIRGSGAIGPVASAVTKLKVTAARADTTLTSLSNAARLAPAMLGADGPRNYLFLVQNLAESRATGGISGSLAMVHTDNGAISLGQQSSVVGFHFVPPLSDVPAQSEGLYGSVMGEYIQDVNLSPQFPVAAPLAAEMWQRRYGLTPNGVITIDPVVLAGVLKATGPLTLATGQTIDSQNAVQVLLSQVYQDGQTPAANDAFFADTAGKIFQRVAEGDVDPTKLVSALASSASDRRILIWNADASEQKVLAGTALAGELPPTTRTTAGIGVYLNDGTGGKMDYYLHTSVGSGGAVCRADGRPQYQVDVRLTSEAPADAATALPSYVTGADAFGVPLGTVRTRVAVYGPVGSLLTGESTSAASVSTQSNIDTGRPVSYVTVDLTPGASVTLTVTFLGTKGTPTRTAVDTTPALHISSSRHVALGCSTR